MLPSTELTDRPGRGRTYAEAVRPAIADAGPTGRVRLDAIARWLQDAAYYDLVDDAPAARSERGEALDRVLQSLSR